MNSFKAEPNEICRGSQVRLTWDASKAGTLAATPTIAGMGPVASHGNQLVAPAATTHFHLEVSNLFGHAGRDVDVAVQDTSNLSKTLSRSMADSSADCDAKSFWVTAVAPPDFWDQKLKVGRVSSADGRRYHVEHAGTAGDVAPGAPSDAFNGVAVSGDWKLTTPVGAGEECHKNGPRSLMIEIIAACSP